MTAPEFDWRPAASLAALQDRAAGLKWLRDFFSDRGVLEVETPLLMSSTVTDPHIEGFSVPFSDHDRYLQTSPEYAMKRLLAAGSGSIFQICKAFRVGEVGRKHNPEFTILEWYREGFDHFDLMDEVELLVGGYLGRGDVTRISYAELFEEYFEVNPHSIDDVALTNLARSQLDTDFKDATRDTWLDLLMSGVIEPQLARRGLVFVYDFPASQAALSRLTVTAQGDSIGQRFELYVDGVELVNGYHELLDAEEQRRRFERDNEQRKQLSRPPRALDEKFLAALDSGIPACAGAALGVDRLLMLACKSKSIAEAVSFDWVRA